MLYIAYFFFLSGRLKIWTKELKEAIGKENSHIVLNSLIISQEKNTLCFFDVSWLYTFLTSNRC